VKLIDHPQIAVTGGFGHAGCVFDELLASPGFANLCGMAPAYDGESLAGFLSHPWMKTVQIFDKVDDMLSRAQPDVLIVSTRPDKIFSAAMAGLARGCHLILEKPVGLNFENLATLQGTADKASLRIMAMLSMRSFPTFIEARDQIAKGAIGKTVLINTRKSYKWGTRPAWFNDRDKLGGLWPWIGIHNLDMAHFVTDLHACKVSATQHNLAHPGLAGFADVAAGIFEMEGGVRMTASIDVCRPGSAATWGDDWIRVVGSGGVLEASASTGIVTLLTEGCEVVQIECGTGPEPIYIPFLKSLNRPLGADEKPSDLATRLTSAALAADASAQTGEWKCIAI